MFAAASVDLRGAFSIATAVETAFELFSPLGEKRWVPGWNPELLHPPGVGWARGLIFRTREATGEAVWVVSALDRERHEVEYHRVEPGRYVARVQVHCRPREVARTEVSVRYAFVGLSEAGNREIAAMSEAAYGEKMKRWEQWIGSYLATGSAST